MKSKIIKIGKSKISTNSKTYFIADIAANHDGSLTRAKKLIRLCASAGANAAKFQHFKAETIVLDEGFKKIGKITHQSKWKKSVFEVYKKSLYNSPKENTFFFWLSSKFFQTDSLLLETLSKNLMFYL